MDVLYSVYMNDKEQIFWVLADRNHQIGYSFYDDPTNCKYGIYDLNTNKSIIFGECDKYHGIKRLCYDDINGIIYLLDNKEKLIQFDVNKNEWKILCQQKEHIDHRSFLWINSLNILSRFDLIFNMKRFENHNLCAEYMDIQQGHIKWQHYDNKQIMHYFKHCQLNIFWWFFS